MSMLLQRKIKPTITPCLLDPGDTLQLTLSSGRIWEMSLKEATATVVSRGFDRYHDGGHASGDITVYAFEAVVTINGTEHLMRREVGSDASFYEPWHIDGVRVWFDAAACTYKDAGGFMEEKDWRSETICKPQRLTRWAVQEEGKSICPATLHDWYPNPSGRLSIQDCYTGEDCWMGPYNGGAAHGGLDINMPAGTLLSTPIDLDDHYLFHSAAAGFNNNRWIGSRRWPDGSDWQLTTSHLIEMTVKERTPLAAGTPYATTAGTRVGQREHTHFKWRVNEQGGSYWLDPWIMLYETWEQRKTGNASLQRKMKRI